MSKGLDQDQAGQDQDQDQHFGSLQRLSASKERVIAVVHDPIYLLHRGSYIERSCFVEFIKPVGR